MLPTVEELSEDVEMVGKATHDNVSRARSTAALGVFGVRSCGVWETLTDTSDPAVRLVLSSLVPLGVGVYGRSLALGHRSSHVLK